MITFKGEYDDLIFHIFIDNQLPAKLAARVNESLNG